MNTNHKITTRPTLSLPFGGRSQQPIAPASTAVLSSHELKRIVAAMLG